MDWVRGELTGHEFDLDLLAAIFAAGEPRVYREGGRWWVESEQFDGAGDDVVRLHDTAKGLLVRLNAAGRLEQAGFRPVALRSKYERRGPSGAAEHGLVEAKAAEIRIRARTTAEGTVVRGSEESQPAPAIAQSVTTPRIAALSSSRPEVLEVAQLLSVPELDWVVLYKVLEVVTDSYGPDHQNVAKADLVGARELSRFTASANHPSASGAAARHARQRGSAPKDTMSLPEGIEFIRRLVSTWLAMLEARRAS